MLAPSPVSLLVGRVDRHGEAAVIADDTVQSVESPSVAVETPPQTPSPRNRLAAVTTAFASFWRGRKR
ncbi:MAG: hypothetical protein MHM6MM_005808 [Cercozoa sp. M6MM]